MRSAIDRQAIAHVHDELDGLTAAVDEALGGQPADPAGFAETAASVLRDVRPRLEVPALLEALSDATHYPEQSAPGAGSWGDPGITLVRGDGWFVDAYLFPSPSLSVHSHAFSGAFTLLGGVAGHTLFGHVGTPEVDGDLLIGDLRAIDTEILGPGDVRAIKAGLEMIHSVIHLSAPTVSLVVRTPADARLGLYAFYLPGLGMRVYGGTGVTDGKKIHLLDTLVRLRDSQLGARAATLMNSVDATTVVMMATRYPTSDRTPPLADVLARTRHHDASWLPALIRAHDAGTTRPATDLLDVGERSRLERCATSILGEDPAVDALLAAFDARG